MSLVGPGLVRFQMRELSLLQAREFCPRDPAPLAQNPARDLISFHLTSAGYFGRTLVACVLVICLLRGVGRGRGL